MPFAMEDRSMIWAHGQAALRMLAKHAVAKGRLSLGPKLAAPPPPVAVSMWISKRQHRLPTWLHLTMPVASFCGNLRPPLPAGTCYS
jgi:hypothetical protein